MFVRIKRNVIKVKNCKGFASLFGLAFDEMKSHGGALIYSNSVWMPFVKHDLDLLFLDNNFRIVNIQKAVPITLNPKTWKSYKCKKAKYCLELKAGLISARKGMKIAICGHR